MGQVTEHTIFIGPGEEKFERVKRNKGLVPFSIKPPPRVGGSSTIDVTIMRGEPTEGYTFASGWRLVSIVEYNPTTKSGKLTLEFFESLEELLAQFE